MEKVTNPLTTWSKFIIMLEMGSYHSLALNQVKMDNIYKPNLYLGCLLSLFQQK